MSAEGQPRSLATLRKRSSTVADWWCRCGCDDHLTEAECALMQFLLPVAGRDGKWVLVGGAKLALVVRLHRGGEPDGCLRLEDTRLCHRLPRRHPRLSTHRLRCPPPCTGLFCCSSPLPCNRHRHAKGHPCPGSSPGRRTGCAFVHREWGPQRTALRDTVGADA